LTVWWIILGLGVVSLLLRTSFLVLLRNRRLPEGVTASLSLVPAAVLSALVAPELFVHGGRTEILGPRLMAGALAGAVAWKTRNVLWTLVVGLGFLFAAEALGWK